MYFLLKFLGFYLYIYIYIYKQKRKNLSLSPLLSLYIYIYIIEKRFCRHIKDSDAWDSHESCYVFCITDAFLLSAPVSLKIASFSNDFNNLKFLLPPILNTYAPLQADSPQIVFISIFYHAASNTRVVDIQYQASTLPVPVRAKFLFSVHLMSLTTKCLSALSNCKGVFLHCIQLKTINVKMILRYTFNLHIIRDYKNYNDCEDTFFTRIKLKTTTVEMNVKIHFWLEYYLWLSM